MNRPRITIPCPTANASSPHDAYQTRPMLSLAVAALLGVVSCAIGCGDGAEPPGTPHDLEIASLGDSAATLNRDLRKYFPPVKGRNVLRTHTGARYAAYSWYNAHRLAPKYDHFIRLYQRLFELQKNGKPLPGQLYVFSKKYAARQCVTTYAHLFFGKDKSVTEAGDWYFGPDCQPPVAFGYQGVDGRAAGLSWSAAGGLANPSRVFNLKVMRQLSSGTAYAHHNSRAWNATRVLRHYDSYTLPYGFDRNGRWRAGAGRTFRDVIRLVFDHGTRQPGRAEIYCRPNNEHPYSGYYYHMPGYNSYTSEFYLAKGIGIIQEAFVFVEDGQYFGMKNCSGLAFDGKPHWVSYHE
jgi:hypothetical protein